MTATNSVSKYNCLVGAGALVTEGKSFPDNSLIVGAPARAIRTLDEKGVQMIRAGYMTPPSNRNASLPIAPSR